MQVFGGAERTPAWEEWEIQITTKRSCWATLFTCSDSFLVECKFHSEFALNHNTCVTDNGQKEACDILLSAKKSAKCMRLPILNFLQSSKSRHKN